MGTHIRLQQVVHAGLRHLLRLVELLQGLSDLFVGNLALALLLVVVIQAPSFQLLQMVLKGEKKGPVRSLTERGQTETRG